MHIALNPGSSWVIKILGACQQAAAAAGGTPFVGMVFCMVKKHAATGDQIEARGPTSWTITRYDGPNHLGFVKCAPRAWS